MRGVVLAGGKGTRLGELTRVTNKHLLPVVSVPMIYHPLRKLIGAGIKEIMIVTGPDHVGDFIELLGSGKALGCELTYRVQDESGGIAQALGLAKRFCHDCVTVVILGDNIFQDSLNRFVSEVAHEPDKARIVLKYVHDPCRYGVVSFDAHGNLNSIVEKPAVAPSNYAVAGIYAYPPDVYDIIATLKPSARGELEITDVNNHYLSTRQLSYCLFRGFWTDAGTLLSLREANKLIETYGIDY